MSIREAIKHKILILDGALGTLIQTYGLTEEDFRGSLPLPSIITFKGNNDMLNITKPSVIEDIHRRYLRAVPTSSRPTPSLPSASPRPTTTFSPCLARWPSVGLGWQDGVPTSSPPGVATLCRRFHRTN